MGDVLTLRNISLGGKAGGSEQGVLKVSNHGMGWRSTISAHKVALEVCLHPFCPEL